MSTDEDGLRVIQTADGPVGQVGIASGLEQKPCLTCRKWDKNPRKLMQYLRAQGLKPDADGNYTTTIVQGRQQIKINPNTWGFCKRDFIPTDMRASCKNWAEIRSREELATRIASTGL